MTPRTTPGPRRKSRVDSSNHDPTVANDTATGSPDGGAARDVHTRIAALAYEIYEQRGRQDGYDVEDWLTAEQRVLVGRNSWTA